MLQQHCCRCGLICSRFDDAELRKPSNETLLCVAFVSFIGFASIQIVVAVIAQSEAMLGDSAAMVVDSMTYGFNLYAEKKKNEDFDEDEISADCGAEIEITPVAVGGERNETTDNDIERIRYRRILRQRKRHLHLELMPPVMSVSVLLVVIGLVLHDSIHTLIIDAHRSEKEQSRPNLVLMMTFSVLNLVLDLVNVFCFARAKHLMGYKTDNGEGMNNRENDLDDEAQYEIHDLLENDSEQDGDEEDDDDRVNLNMCSAYTHVFADTLRSIAVIIAAVIAEVCESVTPEVADSMAAIVVSIIILVSLIPLFRGIVHTGFELRDITCKEGALPFSSEDEQLVFENDID